MRVFSVPVSAPFLRTVIAALVDGRLIDGFEPRARPDDLARATLYLPTRRAGRMVREIFLDELKTDAVVLPRIVALGDIDEDELAFAEQAEPYGGVAPLAIPPKLGELDRRLTLARLVAAWAKSPVSAPLVVGGPASTLALASDLARLMDDMVTRGVGWEALDRLVPDQLDQYWQHSLEFLRIARQAWPAHLEEIGKIEPAARRDLLIEAEARRLTRHHDGPVIAAGSTGSMPATAKFLHAVAALPQGAVVLPGLDTDLDDEAWQLIGGVRDAQGKFTQSPAPNHPQFAMQALVTPDRALARRVMAALGRWHLAFDDSGGDELMDTPAGIFARLAAEAVAKQLEPPTLLALLKHPLFRLGGAPGGFGDAVEALELALLRDRHGVALVFEGPHGLALASAFDDLLGRQAQSDLTVQLSDYPEVFQTAFGDRMVRRPEAANAALRIYGPLEARLTQTDRVIIGGLVEGVWPPAPRVDPWLSRPMRHELGLDLPERRVGLSAHDFVQLLGTDDVILSHAAKVGGAPSVASRFLHRLEAVAGEERWEAAKAAGEKYVRFANEIDHPAKVEPIPQPAPKPPRATRPLKLSVTAIEDWLRDPYTIYAKHILKLAPLDPVDMPLSAADRGSAIHDTLGEFTQTFSTALPGNVALALRGIGEKFFAPLMERPEARALWWPRFQRIASWFGDWEIARRQNVSAIDAEIRGEIPILLDNERTFVLSARADRIEHRRDGTFAILDYKTGQPPTGKQVRMGLSPQLTLEAAILREGGFEGIAAGASVSELVYVRLSGNNPPGEQITLELKINKGDQAQAPDVAADYARQELEKLIRKFEDESQAYTSLNLSMWSNRYGAYDDLARIKEWSAAGGLGIEEW